MESWYLTEANTPGKPVNVEHLAAANSAIWQKVLQNTDLQKSKEIYRLWPKIVGIAAALTFLAIGIYFYGQSGITVRNDIAPGKNMAMLTLADGSTIALSDAKTGVVINASSLKYNDGSVIQDADSIHSPGAEAKLTTSTPNGGTYQVILPDGTHVWLNAASSLKFPSKFSSGNREVTLSGEGYFEVTKDKAHPFVVKSKGQEVRVLGTHFNINSYADEPGVKTTLLEGAVMVNDKTILKPGQQSVWDGSVVKVSDADLQVELSWKNGDFIFNGERLESIMRKVSRWYDVDVIYAEGAPKDFVLGGFVSRSKPISAILELLEKTGKVKCKINGRTVMIMP